MPQMSNKTSSGRQSRNVAVTRSWTPTFVHPTVQTDCFHREKGTQRSEWCCPWSVLSRARGSGHECGTNRQRPAPGGRGCICWLAPHLAAPTSAGGSCLTWWLPAHLMALTLPGLYDGKCTTHRDVFLIYFCDSSVTFRLENTHIIYSALSSRVTSTQSASRTPIAPCGSLPLSLPGAVRLACM